jgi:hypothetical protein
VLDPDGWMIPADQRECVGLGGSACVWRRGRGVGAGVGGAWPGRVVSQSAKRGPKVVPSCPDLAHPATATAATGAKRLHSGSKHKSLAAVLQLGRAAQPGHSGRPASHMPLAVIVDDRVEVRCWPAYSTLLARLYCPVGSSILTCPAAPPPATASQQPSLSSFTATLPAHIAESPPPPLTSRVPLCLPCFSAPAHRFGRPATRGRCCRWSPSAPGRSWRRRACSWQAHPQCRCGAWVRAGGAGWFCVFGAGRGWPPGGMHAQGIDLTHKLSMNFPGASACTAPALFCERVLICLPSLLPFRLCFLGAARCRPCRSRW